MAGVPLTGAVTGSAGWIGARVVATTLGGLAVGLGLAGGPVGGPVGGVAGWPASPLALGPASPLALGAATATGSSGCAGSANGPNPASAAVALRASTISARVEGLLNGDRIGRTVPAPYPEAVAGTIHG